MASGFGWRASLLVMLMVVAAGCPAPTGRRRGEASPLPDSGRTCTSATTPVANGRCTREGDVCDVIQVCMSVPGSNRIDTCECLGGTWICTEGRCNNPPEDAGPVACPSTMLRDGDMCTARQGGLYCGSTARDCNNVGTVAIACWCTGSRWSCQLPMCRDGGPDAGFGCPTQPLHTGDSCGSGQQGRTCQATTTDCQGFTISAPCTCNGATWTCMTGRCDGGVRRDAALDASTACPLIPAPGSTCAAGLECRYRAGGTCETYCFCRSIGGFFCETINCSDGGGSDTSVGPETGAADASFEGGLDASMDASMAPDL